MSAHRSGFVGLIGKPNVGKSTMLNYFFGHDVSITSPKPQTTRQRILGILTREHAQVIFIDTPGWHKPKDPLGRYMVAAARQVIEEADVLVAVVDATSGVREEDAWVFERARITQHPTLLAINKADAIKKVRLLPLLEQCAALGMFVEQIPVSAKTGENMEVLLREVIRRLPEGPPWYEPGHTTDQSAEQLIREVIREEVLRAMREEVPHAVAVLLDEMTPKEGVTVIRATIVVEREGQKGIMIGKGGQMLKHIGQRARLKLESRLGCRVFLELWVRVWKAWRKDHARLRMLGYASVVTREDA